MSDQRPTILLIGNFLSAVGFSRGMCEDLAERLQRSGWNVITTSYKPRRLSRLIDFLLTIWLKRGQYSIAQVDVYSGLAFLWAEFSCWLLVRLNKRFILTLHGGNLPQFALRWPRRVRRLLCSADAITTPSRYLLEAMQRFRQDIFLLPNPIDLPIYPFRLRTKPQPHLIWLRAFHSIYNPSLAPRTFAILLPDFPNGCLTMVGPDKGDGSFQEARRAVENLGVLEHVQFSGGVPKSDVPLWLNKGDIFINTTNFDNTPISVLEAMACGLCVVSTNVGGIPYLLEDGQDALLVSPKNPEAMANAVNRILTEPGLAERLSRNARKKVEQFEWSVILPQWKQLIEQVQDIK